MNRMRKLTLTALLWALGILVLGSLSAAAVTAKAATLEEINDPSVFLKQQGGDTCTLCANTMMLRRAALMRGDSDWDSITESVMRPRIWIEGCGMCYEYQYDGFSVNFGKTTNPYSSESELIDLLSRHPEGIVAYDYDYPHAILLTDYTDGVFYCAEPANNVASGRIEASQALVSVSGIEAYWYIENADLSLRDENAFAAVPENLSSLDRDTVAVGESVSISGRASGGSESYVCSYFCQTPSDNGTTLIKENSDSAVFTPSAPGSYRIIVNISDTKTGIVSRKCLPLEVVRALKNTSALSSDTVMLRKSVTLRGSASGGTGNYSYAYYVRTSADSDWELLSDDSSKSSLSFTPPAATNYEFLVRVKDGEGRTAEKTLLLSVRKPLENRSGAASYQIMQGGSLRLTGTAAGGTGSYQYAFYCRKAGTKGWYIIKLYGSEAEASYTPSDFGDYEVLVCVRDGAGTVAKKIFSVTVRQALKNCSEASAQTVSKDTDILLTGAAEGGTGGYTYAFSFRCEGEEDWTLLRGFGTAAETVFCPGEAGSYEVLIRVRDSSGKMKGKILSVAVE